MSDLIAQNGGLLGLLALVAVCLNIIFSAIGKVLDLIKDKTKTEVDNKAAAFIAKVVSVLQKIIDWGSANRSHKE